MKPENGEGQAFAAPSPQDQTSTDASIVHDGVPSCLDKLAAARKRSDTLTARLALKRFQLHVLADGTLLVSRWAWCKPCADLAAAEAFLAQIGGKP